MTVAAPHAPGQPEAGRPGHALLLQRHGLAAIGDLRAVGELPHAR
jgi:hypothetical protein